MVTEAEGMTSDSEEPRHGIQVQEILNILKL